MFNPLTPKFNINSGSKYGPITTNMQHQPRTKSSRVQQDTCYPQTDPSRADDTGKPFWHMNRIWVTLQYLHDGNLIWYVSQIAGPGNDARVDMQIRESNAKIHTHTPTQRHCSNAFLKQREFGNMVTETKTSKNANSVNILSLIMDIYVTRRSIMNVQL